MENDTFDLMGMAKRIDRRTKGKRAAYLVGGVAIVAAGTAWGRKLAPLFVLGGAALLVRFYG